MGNKFENMEMGVEDLRDMSSHRWNVIPEEEFRTLIQDVFHTVASILENIAYLNSSNSEQYQQKLQELGKFEKFFPDKEKQPSSIEIIKIVLNRVFKFDKIITVDTVLTPTVINAGFI